MKKVLVSLSLVLFLGVWAYSQNQASPTGPVMTFEKLVHDYGTIKKGSDGKCEFYFTNTGKEPLILERPRSNCGCTVPDWPQEPIMPGQRQKITVTYDTQRVGPINKQVTVTSNATNSPIILKITGTVVE